ncbi:hypothetical protein JCM10212_003206 [Sporobolomyces blumeae]
MTTLPYELVLACLAQLDPSNPSTVPTLVAVSCASRSFRDLARSAVLWRPLLALDYPRKGKTEKKLGPDATPYDKYRARALVDRDARFWVRELQTPHNRIETMTDVRQGFGVDVVDALSDKAWTSATREPEQHLSLRYWANEARKAILRDEATRTWEGIAERYSRGEEDEADFERGVNAFAAFRGLDPELLERERYDMSNHPELVNMTSSPPSFSTPRDRLEWIAKQVCDYMLAQGLRPSDSGAFHNINNHYVELVFLRAESPLTNIGTLPMTLVAIFCSFVRRLPTCADIEVRPVGFPGTVLVGMRVRGSPEWVHINTFANGRGRLPSRAALRGMLTSLGLDDEPEYYRPASALEMCTRVSRNILTSIQRGESPTQTTGISCLYSVAHSLFALTPRPRDEPNIPGLTTGTPNHVDWLTSIIQAEFPLDTPFLVDRVLPVLRRPVYRSPETLTRIERVDRLVEALEHDDRSIKEPKWVNGRIRWQIGHVFRHRLFDYYAVVRGWDYTCKASETWIMQMQVDRLPFGRDQPFYHVIVQDGSTRYVAQENITDVAIPRPYVDLFLANESIGRYFRKLERIGPGPGEEGEGEEVGEGKVRFVKSQETESEYPDG